MPDASQMDAEQIETIIVGLGNPGKQYRRNRHNVGFLTVDALARQTPGAWSTYLLSRVCRTELSGRQVLLAKSLTYMNQSGEAVQALMTALNRSAKDLLLVYDDLDLPLGRIRIRRKGSAGGHRGVESILTIFETEEITRVRVGIGETEKPDNTESFVLSDFPPEKQTELDGMIIKAGDAVKSILRDGVSKSMAIFNA